MSLAVDGHPRHHLAEGNAFVLPPRLAVAVRKPSDDLEFVEVALPPEFSANAL